MTIKEYRENMTYDNQKEIAKRFQCWLGKYTDEVIVKVMSRIDEILNDEMTMKLIEELYNRTQKEIEDETRDIMNIIEHPDFIEYSINNHCLTHADSYRDVLYDMYIK